MTVGERILYLFAPQKAVKKVQRRISKDIRMENGYGNYGASTTKNNVLGWVTGAGSAEQDIDLHGSALRERARDLDVGGGLARGAVRRLQTAVVGAGLTPKPRINADVLGMSAESANEWEKKAKAEFMAWAQSRECDASGQQTFFQLQSLIMLSMLISGDVFILLPQYDSIGTPYKTHIRVLEADRVGTEDSNGESEVSELDNGNRVIDGVEVDASGRVVAYWITSKHPLNTDNSADLTYERIEAFGKETGMPNVLHPFEPERPEQRRGMPFVAPVIEKLKQLDRYMNSELAASLVASMLTVFFTTQTDPVGMPIEDPMSEDDRVTTDEEKIELMPGGIYTLKPGVQPVTVNPSRSNASFQAFVESTTTYIGSALGIPIEVLNERFNSSYSASRAALLEFWRGVKMRRQWFVYDVCQPIYEAWLSEAVALGRIECPGFWADPLIRAAWCGVEWVGASMGQIDPLKEVNAAIARINTGISTREREAAEFNGSNFAENAQVLKNEAALMRDIVGDDEDAKSD